MGLLVFQHSHTCNRVDRSILTDGSVAHAKAQKRRSGSFWSLFVDWFIDWHPYLHLVVQHHSMNRLGEIRGANYSDDEGDRNDSKSAPDVDSNIQRCCGT